MWSWPQDDLRPRWTLGHLDACNPATKIFCHHTPRGRFSRPRLPSIPVLIVTLSRSGFLVRVAPWRAVQIRAVHTGNARRGGNLHGNHTVAPWVHRETGSPTRAIHSVVP